MKRNFIKRSIASFLLFLFLFSPLSIVGCALRREYRSDVPVSELLAAATTHCPVSGGYGHADSDFLEFNLPDVLPYVDDYGIAYSVPANDYTEIGILRVHNARDAETVLGAVEAYLRHFKATYEPQARQYDPSEAKKLRDASCTLYGNYVIYTIMSTEEQASCKDAVTSCLLPKKA